MKKKKKKKIPVSVSVAVLLSLLSVVVFLVLVFGRRRRRRAVAATREDLLILERWKWEKREENERINERAMDDERREWEKREYDLCFYKDKDNGREPKKGQNGQMAIKL